MLEMRHNLVSVLYTVKGYVESHLCRFEEGRFRDDDEALQHAREMMKRIYSQTDKALLITKRIGLAMKALPKASGDIEHTSVKDVWQEVTGMLQRQRSKSGHIEIISHIASEFPNVLCDKNDLTEILYCLADNAAQAMSYGKNTQSSDQKEKGKLIIRASLGFRAKEVPIATITIADTGPGIPEEILNRLFEPFVTTKEQNGGNGLGLCIVNALVRRNGGSITVSSFKGCGTTFMLTFPVAQAYRQKEDLALVG
ncbi:MAG TPA: HAMP domain-containing sensor histidine kinase [Candidatus Omnitrophota bacterium]|nr:HAMP domain-containing sensor histidine kinase [Candidatus Omnitrophota bacterium]